MTPSLAPLLHEGLKLDAQIVRRKIEALLQPIPGRLVDQQEPRWCVAQTPSEQEPGLSFHNLEAIRLRLNPLGIVGVEGIKEQLTAARSEWLDAVHTNG